MVCAVLRSSLSRKFTWEYRQTHSTTLLTVQTEMYVNSARLKWLFLSFPHYVFQYLDGTCLKSRQRVEGACKLRVGNILLSKPHLRQRLDCTWYWVLHLFLIISRFSWSLPISFRCLTFVIRLIHFCLWCYLCLVLRL